LENLLATPSLVRDGVLMGRMVSCWAFLKLSGLAGTLLLGTAGCGGGREQGSISEGTELSELEEPVGVQQAMEIQTPRGAGRLAPCR
jgi:hypothetical protein